MIEITPAILETTFQGITDKLEQLVGITRNVQIDICDGDFVSSVTWPYVNAKPEGSKHYDAYFKQIVGGNGEVDMPLWEDFDFELDLMIKDVTKLLPDLLTIGPSRIVLHEESFSDIHSSIHELTKIIPPIVEVGVAVNIDTDLAKIYPVLDEKMFSFVQCMGIDNVGYQHQAFDEKVFEKLKTLRQKYPDLELSVDGAVNLDDAKKLVDAGATRLVIGSAIFSAKNISERIAEFERVVQ